MFAYVLNAGWAQLGIGPVSFHDQLLPPPVPNPSAYTFEGPAPMGWPPGAMIAHKKAPKVLVDGNPGIQQGHDVGYGILHLNYPPNGLLAVHILLAKHKVMIPVSSVLLQGKPVGTYYGVVCLGLICANPYSLPLGFLIPLKGTVQTSATLGDLLKGLAYIAMDIVVDVLWRKLGGVRGMLGSWWKWRGDLLALDWYWAMARLPPLLSKIVESVAKGWTFSPLVGGLLRGSPGIGKGKAGWKPFGSDKW